MRHLNTRTHVCSPTLISQALDYVMGFTIANDVTARRWQGKKGGGQWVLSKSFDTFCPLGPFVVSPREVDPTNLRIQTIVNGEVMQVPGTARAGHTARCSPVSNPFVPVPLCCAQANMGVPVPA